MTQGIPTMTKQTKRCRCSICSEWYAGFGNNAEPVDDGRCCDDCNNSKVLPARVAQWQLLLADGESRHD
jgi:hypothetical protein